MSALCERKRIPTREIFHPETIAHYDRVLADGGVIPDLYLLNQVVDLLKKRRSLNDFALVVDPQATGYKLGVGAGVTAGRAANKLYSIHAASDLVQGTVANQPLLLLKPNKKYAFFGGNNDHLQAPSIANTISGDLDVIAHIQSDNYALNYQGIFSRLIGSSAISFYVYTFSGNASLEFSLNGTSTIGVQSTAPIPYSGGQAFWLRVTRVASTGLIRFFHKATEAASWTQLGADITQASGALFNNASGVFAIGGAPNTSIPFSGSIHYAQYSSTIGGEPGLVMDPEEFDRSKSPNSWTSKTGQVWTLTRTGSSGIRAQLVDRPIVVGDGTLYFMKAAPFTWNGPGTVYGVLHNHQDGSERGIWDGNEIFHNSLFTDTGNQLQTIVGSTISRIARPTKLGLIIAKYGAGAYSLGAYPGAPITSTSNTADNWEGFTLLARGNSSQPSNTSVTAIVGTKALDTPEQIQNIVDLLTLTHGNIFA